MIGAMIVLAIVYAITAFLVGMWFMMEEEFEVVMAYALLWPVFLTRGIVRGTIHIWTER